MLITQSTADHNCYYPTSEKTMLPHAVRAIYAVRRGKLKTER